MRPTPFVLALLLLPAAAQARAIQWGEELGTDAVLAAAGFGLDRFAPRGARSDGGDFPTQRFDDRAHRAVHPAAVADWRRTSNASVVLAAASPAVAAFAADDDAALGRILTTGHALLFANVAVEGAKKAVRRPRPTERHAKASAVEGDDALSFPSGHSAAAFTGATLVARFFPAATGLKVGAYGVAALTAYARMAGDKHYATDVLTGGAIGAGAAVLADTLYEGESKGVSVRPVPGGIAFATEF